MKHKLFFEYVAETGSTNDDLLLRIDEVANNDNVIIRSCQKQHQGRGQQHKKWHSPKEAILCSLSLAYQPQGFTALIVALAIVDALVLLYPQLKSLLKIKWPNDLLIQTSEKFFYKIGGILLEYRRGVLVIGFGINLESDRHACELFNEMFNYCLFNYINYINDKELELELELKSITKQVIIQTMTHHILQFLKESEHDFCKKHQQLWCEYSALQSNTLINQGVYDSINFQTGGVVIDNVEHASITLDWSGLKKYL